MGVSLPSYRVGGVRVDGVYFRSAVAPMARSNEPMLRRQRLVQRLVRDSPRVLDEGWLFIGGLRLRDQLLLKLAFKRVLGLQSACCTSVAKIARRPIYSRLRDRPAVFPSRRQN